MIVILERGVTTSPEVLAMEVAAWKTNPSWSGRAAILVIVTGGQQEAQIVITELWRQVKAANVVVMAASSSTVEIFTSQPYSPLCSAQAVSMGKWVPGSPFNYTLFPQKTYLNLNQCKVTAASTEFPPFVDSPDLSNRFTHGLEVMLFKSLAEQMNFSYEVIASPDGQSPWFVLIDGVPAGLVGRLYRHEADFAFHGIRMSWDRFRLVDIIDSYYGGSFVWAAPLAERAPLWISFFVVFDHYMWLGTFLSLAASAAVLTIITTKGAVNAVLAIWASTLNTSLPYECAPSREILFRLFIVFYFIYGINITTAYQSGIFGILTKGLTMTPMESAIEALRQGYIANMYPSNIPDLIANHPIFYEYVTSNNLANWTEDHINALRRVALQQRQIALYADTAFLYEMNRRFTTKAGKPLARALKERHSTYEPVFMMARDHPLQLTVQASMRRLMEGGWVEYHVRNLVDRRYVTDLENVEENDEGGGRKLSVEQLVGAFAMHLFLLVVSAVVLVVELTCADQHPKTPSMDLKKETPSLQLVFERRRLQLRI